MIPLLPLLWACTWRGCATDAGQVRPEVSDLAPFPINLVVLVDDPRAPTATSVHTDPDDPSVSRTGAELLTREVDLLNQHFVAADGGPVCDANGCVSFEFRSSWFYDEIRDTDCRLLRFGRMEDQEVLEAGDLARMDKAVRRCDDERLVDPTAINFYIYDRCLWDDTTGTADCSDINSHGASNADSDGIYHPMVALDLVRLQHQTASPEEHEMGHALGLRHVCDPAIDGSSDASNIMQQHCKNETGTCANVGHGGDRSLGFGVVDYESRDCVVDQVAQIMERARDIQSQW